MRLAAKVTARFHAAGGTYEWALRRAEWPTKPDEPMGLEAARTTVPHDPWKCWGWMVSDPPARSVVIVANCGDLLDRCRAGLREQLHFEWLGLNFRKV